jgi:hypothetical protein
MLDNWSAARGWSESTAATGRNTPADACPTIRAPSLPTFDAVLKYGTNTTNSAAHQSNGSAQDRIVDAGAVNDNRSLRGTHGSINCGGRALVAYAGRRGFLSVHSHGENQQGN